MIKSSLVIVALLFSTVIASANTCVDIFKAPSDVFVELSEDKIELSGVRILRDDSPQQIKSKKDPRYRESIKNLLMMLTETQFENISKKDLNRKGDLRLGKVFDDGLSLEFVYEGDKRGHEDFFFLKEVKLIKPNGARKDLDETPVPDIGLPAQERTVIIKKEKLENDTSEIKAIDDEVVRDLISDSKAKPAELQKKIDDLQKRIQEVKVPYKIEGVLLEGLRTWSGYVHHVKRPKMRSRIENDQIQRLLFEAGALRSVRWVGRILNKMLIKDVIRNAILIGLIYNVTAPSKVETTAAPAPVTQPVQTQNANRDKQIIDLVADLTKKETDSKGSPLFFTGSQKDAGMILTAQSKDSNLLISVFPKQEKIVIIPETKANEKASPIILTRVEHQKAYDFISNQMEALYAGRR